MTVTRHTTHVSVSLYLQHTTVLTTDYGTVQYHQHATALIVVRTSRTTSISRHVSSVSPAYGLWHVGSASGTPHASFILLPSTFIFTSLSSVNHTTLLTARGTATAHCMATTSVHGGTHFALVGCRLLTTSADSSHPAPQTPLALRAGWCFEQVWSATLVECRAHAP